MRNNILYITTIQLYFTISSCHDDLLDFKKLDYHKMKTFGFPKLKPNLSGYINMSPDGEVVHNIFWMLYESKKVDPKKAPLLAWTNGGPGSSDSSIMYGFGGPMHVHKFTNSLKENKFGFNQFANFLVIEFPFGTGFSFAKSPEEIALTKARNWAENYNRFLTRWYQENLNYYNHDLYLAGDSLWTHLSTRNYYVALRTPETNLWLKNLKGQLLEAPLLTQRTIYQTSFANRQAFHLLEKANVKNFKKTLTIKHKNRGKNYSPWGRLKVMDTLHRYKPKGTNQYDMRQFTMYNRNLKRWKNVVKRTSGPWIDVRFEGMNNYYMSRKNRKFLKIKNQDIIYPINVEAEKNGLLFDAQYDYTNALKAVFNSGLKVIMANGEYDQEMNHFEFAKMIKRVCGEERYQELLNTPWTKDVHSAQKVYNNWHILQSYNANHLVLYSQEKNTYNFYKKAIESS